MPRKRFLRPCAGCGVDTLNDKYCSNKCQFVSSRAARVEAWKSGADISIAGGFLPTWVRKYLIAVTDNRCQECGWSGTNPYSGMSVLEVDHIDGDARNNAFENIRLVCPNCHAMSPTYRGLNSASGRAKYGRELLDRPSRTNARTRT